MVLLIMLYFYECWSVHLSKKFVYSISKINAYAYPWDGIAFFLSISNKVVVRLQKITMILLQIKPKTHG